MTKSLPPLSVVGIVNVTPDSFSDGGVCLDSAAAIKHAEELLASGADIVEIGGDSTRPGSTCTGAAAEWARIEPVVRALAKRMPLSIDTHHAETAARALDLGATMINDVTAGSDPSMFRTIAPYRCKLVLMFSRCSPPHHFGAEPAGDLVSALTRFFNERSALAEAAGVPRELIVRDTGMGAFVSADPERSWEIIQRYGEIPSGAGGLMFGSSRKGFLKSANETSPHDRDHASALTAALALEQRRGFSEPVYVRTHNPRLQRALLAPCKGLI